MNTIIAVKFNPRLFNGFKILDNLKNYKFDELVIHANGVKLPEDLIDSESLPFEVTIFESDIEIEPDKVLRTIVSYVHHTYGDGRMYILEGSDTIPESDSWLDDANESGFIIKDNCIENPEDIVSFNSTPSGLFSLKYPFGIVPILDIEILDHVLTSRDLYSYYEYFTGVYDVHVYQSLGLMASIPDVIQISDKYGINLINESDFDGMGKNIVKYLLSRIKD